MLYLKKTKRFISLFLTVVMLMCFANLTSYADAQSDYDFVPTAFFTASGVTRVAKDVDSVEHGTTIVAATPSGVPELSSSSNSEVAYAGETPQHTTLTLNLDVVPDETPTVFCENTSLSLVSAEDKTYTWEIVGGNAQAGSTLDITAKYDYQGKTYETHAFSYVCDIETNSAYAITYHTVKTTFTTHKYYAQNAVNSRIMGSNVVYNLEKGDTVDSYYDYKSGKINFGDSSSYKTSLYFNVTDKTSTGSSGLSSVDYANVSNKAIADIYFDTSEMTNFSDASVRYVVNGGTKYDLSNSTANSTYFNTLSKIRSAVVRNGFADATLVNDDPTASAKLKMDFTYSTGTDNFASNVLATNSPLKGNLSDVKDGDCFTINSQYVAENNDSLYYDIKNTLNMPTFLRIHKYDKHLLREAIEYVLTTPVDNIEIDKTTGKGINPQKWYYSKGYPEFLQALSNANAVSQKIDVTQTQIDEAANNLYSAYENLELAGADYTSTNAFLSVADVYYENHPSYLEEQFQNLVGKVDSINKNCHILAQPAVEKMNAELLEALNSMKLVPADYTQLAEALEHKPEYDGKYYTEQSYTAWKTLAVEAESIIENELLSHYQQEEVYAMAQALLDALGNLELKDADLSALYDAINLVTYDVSFYKDEQLYDCWHDLYEQAQEYVLREGLTSLNDDEILLLASNLTQAHNDLQLKEANLSSLEKAVALKEKVEEENCAPESYLKFINAIHAGELMLSRNGLTILDNDDISTLAQNIVDAFLELELVEADKSLLETALSLAPAYNAEFYTQETYSVYISARERAYEIYNDNTLLHSDNETVNEAARTLSDAFAALELKAADKTPLENALALVPEYDESEYTQESFARYTSAVNDARAVLERNDLTILDNEAIERAALAIISAYNALEKAKHTFEAKEGTGAVIDRDAGFIYGIAQGVSDLNNYIDFENCTVKYIQTSAGFGTGTKVQVIKNDEVVEEYTLVIRGDVTGDGFVDTFDLSRLSSAANFEFDFDENSAYLFAADVNSDGFIDVFDASFLSSVANFEIEFI